MADQRFDMRDPGYAGSSLATEASDSLRYSNWLLVELEFELQKAPRRLREQTLQEVEEHLCCSRMALIELGASETEADKQAVASFGSPNAFVRQLLGDGEDKRRDAVVIWVGALICAYFATVLPFTDMAAIWIGVWVGLPIFVWSCCYARSFALRKLLIATLLGSIMGGIFMGFTWMSLWEVGGMGVSPRYGPESGVSQALERRALLNECFRVYDVTSKTFKSGPAAVQTSVHYRHGRYEAFQRISNLFNSPRAITFWTDSYEAASDSWNRYERIARPEWARELGEIERNLVAKSLASQIPFHERMAREGAVASLVLWCSLFAINGVVYVLYRLTRRRRDDRRIVA